MQANDVLEKWKKDLHNLQMQLTELELSKKKITAEIKETAVYQQKLGLGREVRKLRVMIEQRSNKLAGVEELFNELKKYGSAEKNSGKVVAFG